MKNNKIKTSFVSPDEVKFFSVVIYTVTLDQVRLDHVRYREACGVKKQQVKALHGYLLGIKNYPSPSHTLFSIYFQMRG